LKQYRIDRRKERKRANQWKERRNIKRERLYITRWQTQTKKNKK
jgi:hypothetical protein